MKPSTNNQQPTTKFYSNGKLLLTSEYLVLDGAKALAIPTRFGQELEVQPTNSGLIEWKAYNSQKELWLDVQLDSNDFSLIDGTCTFKSLEKTAKTLQDILRVAKALNPSFLEKTQGVLVKTELTFPNEWGLGTSSTLINSIADWAQVNAFQLLEQSFGGSGYDIACAQNNNPIFYTRNGIHPKVETVVFNPPFKEDLFFVFLNQKQDSKEGIQMYRNLEIDKQALITQFDELTQQISEAETLDEFEGLIEKHERILGETLGIQPVKQRLFLDYSGQVKSLGAWGGDFVLVTGDKEYVPNYFISRGYTTILSFEEMGLEPVLNR